MKSKLAAAVLLALVAASGCASSENEQWVIDPSSPDYSRGGGNGAKGDVIDLTAEPFVGAEVACAMTRGTDTDDFFRNDDLNCVVSLAQGFSLQNASVLVQAADSLAEAQVGEELTHIAGFAGEKYPMQIDVTLNYHVETITSENGVPAMSTHTVECSTTIGSPEEGAQLSCAAPEYERWVLQVLPDDELLADWDAGEHRAASFVVSVADAQAPIPARWDHVAQRGEVLGQTLQLLVPKAGAGITASLTAKVPYNAAGSEVPILGAGGYEIHADGSLSPLNL